MAITRQQIQNKARSIIQAIDRVERTERTNQADAQFAEDFNGLLKLAKEIRPDVDTRLWPKPAKIFDAMGQAGTDVSFVGLDAASRQVCSLVVSD